MSTSPYMPFYFADYMADTYHLSAEEHGTYLLLIAAYWQSGKALPNNDEKLARTAKCSVERWQTLKLTLSEYFTDVNGMWVHKRIEKELDKFRDKSEKARNANLASQNVRKRSNFTDVSTNAVTDVSTNVPTDGSPYQISDIRYIDSSLSQTREVENNHIVDTSKKVETDHIGDDNELIEVEELPPLSRRDFVPPTKEQVLNRFKDIGRAECGLEFYEHWAGVRWKDPQGRYVEWDVKIGKWLRDQEDYDKAKPAALTRGSPSRNGAQKPNRSAAEMLLETQNELRGL